MLGFRLLTLCILLTCLQGVKLMIDAEHTLFNPVSSMYGLELLAWKAWAADVMPKQLYLLCIL